MLDENCLYVQDEHGVERKMTILFTFDNPEGDKHYVVFQDPEADDDQVYASRYTDEGELLPIESEDEWNMVEEVIGAFSDDDEEADD